MSVQLDIPEGIEPGRFFEHTVFPVFRFIEAEGFPHWLEFNFELALSDPDSRWGVRVEDGRFHFLPGGIEDPDIVLAMSHRDWHNAIRQGHGHWIDRRIVKYLHMREQVDLIQSTRGKLILRLTANKGRDTVFEVALKFQGADDPMAMISTSQRAYFEMSRGKLNPVLALAMRRIRFSGDMKFLMSLAPLRRRRA